MRRFRFSLEPVLRLRRQRLELHEQQVQEADAALRARREHLSAVNEQESSCVRELHAAGAGELDIQRMRLMRRHLSGLQHVRHGNQVAMVRAQIELGECRRRMMQVARDTLVVEQLRDTEFERHTRAENTRMQNELDEAAVLRAARREPEEDPCTG
jgi:flagellar protein FliJ